jgi:carboxylesterase type B
VWHYEFRHLLPSRVHPRGFGCDNGIELDIVPVNTPGTPASVWATHSADVRFVFGTHLGADSVQASGGHNQSHCPFTPAEARLSDDMGRYWAALARTGDPNGDSAGGSASPTEFWPEYTAEGDRASRTLRTGDGIRGTPQPSAVKNRLHEEDCAFWEGLWPVAHPASG